MRTTFHAELDELMTDLAGMARLTAQMMINASISGRIVAGGLDPVI